MRRGLRVEINECLHVVPVLGIGSHETSTSLCRGSTRNLKIASCSGWSFDSLNRILAISGAAEPHKGLYELGIPTSTKLVHKGFVRITPPHTGAPPPTPVVVPTATATSSEAGSSNEPPVEPSAGVVPAISVTDGIEPEYATPFTMAHWHLPPSCEHLRAALLQNYIPVPLNAVLYGSEEPILPIDYASTLRGALVEARFSLRYMILRREDGPVTHFTATVEELIVLERPAVLLPSPIQVRSCSRFLKRDRNEHEDGNTKAPAKRSTPSGSKNPAAKRTRS
ncbi:hypothetical protein BDV93DRAFT_516085 [Ceratobasidium sp. AG-I]|nr:hypothetical protein BDV93DRAFT_516085 [Ceratobasidium sp. AG-I]